MRFSLVTMILCYTFSGIAMANSAQPEPILGCSIYKVEGQFPVAAGSQPLPGDQLSVDLNQTKIESIIFTDDSEAPVSTLRQPSVLKRVSLKEQSAEYLASAEGWELKLAIMSADGIKNVVYISDNRKNSIFLYCTHRNR